METGIRGDLEWGTIPHLARAGRPRGFGDAEAVVDGDVRLSFRELAAAADHAGRAFLAAGIRTGDRVAIWSPNVHEWIVALLGLQSAGGVVVPINTRYKGAEAAYILAKSRARVLVTVNGFLGNDYVAMLDGHDLPDLEHTVVLRGDAPAGSVSWSTFLARGDLADQADLDRRLAGLGAADTSDILFTSGTTGNPKGVVATHGQTLRGFADWAAIVGLRQDDRYLVVNPFFHAFGYKAGIVASLTVGATLVPQAVFDIPMAMANVAEHAITALPGPPAIYQTFLNHPDLDRERMQSLRLAVTGAAPVPVELIERMEEELGFETVVTAYGLTECCGIVTVCRPDDPPERISGSSGRAIPGVEVRIVADDGREVPRGEPGEVVVRGYNVMQGYFEAPEQTAEVIDADGWLHTGDVGTMDADGYVAITDRKKDMFISGGFNVYPAEIERLLLLHPDIAQAAVIGVPDERMGEVGLAFVVAAGGADLDAEAVVAWAREQMAGFKAPRTVRIVDALPMNASNKVLKNELRLLAAFSGHLTPRQIAGYPDAMAEVTPLHPADDDDELRAADGRVPGRRGRATRQRLLECTRDMLTTTSYRDVKVIDIAREAGTSPATFYQYFADVEAAILVLAEEMAQQGQHLTGIITDGSWVGSHAFETSLALVDAFLAFWDDHRPVLRVMDLATDEGDGRFQKIRVRLLNDITNALADVTRASQVGGGLPPGLDPMAVAGTLVSMLAHTAAHQYGFEFWGIRTAKLRESMARQVSWGVTGITPPD